MPFTWSLAGMLPSKCLPDLAGAGAGACFGDGAGAARHIVIYIRILQAVKFAAPLCVLSTTKIELATLVCVAYHTFTSEVPKIIRNIQRKACAARVFYS